MAVATSTADSVTKTSAVLYGAANSSGARMTECGMYLGTSENSLTRLGSDKINSFSTKMWYDTAKYGRTLQPGTTYYYQAYAVAGGKEVKGDVRSFTTQAEVNTVKGSISLDRTSVTLPDNACVQLNASTTPGGSQVVWWSDDPSIALVNTKGQVTAVAPGQTKIGASMLYGSTKYFAYCTVTVTASPPAPAPAAPVTVSTGEAQSVTGTSAVLYGSAVSTGEKITACGMYLGTSADTMTALGHDFINTTTTNMWYSTVKYGRTLQPGTTYYYRAFALSGGTLYYGETRSFTTPAASVENTRVGVVTGTGGRDLAINDKAAASPTYSNQIGRIPAGAQLTVYPDKASGNWYWVSYGGVSGYAYGKYITLQ